MAGNTKDGRTYLLRHGETEWSATGRHTSHSEIPLTSRGQQQARRAGAVLSRLRGTDVPPALVLASPRDRALRTAELAGLRVDEVADDLAEWDYGEYEGLTTEQIRENVPGWTVWTHPCPGGETADDVAARATKVLDRVRTALSGGDIVLVGHGHFSRVLIAAWLGMPPSAGVHFGLDAAGISVLGDERGVPQLSHLDLPPWGDGEV